MRNRSQLETTKDTDLDTLANHCTLCGESEGHDAVAQEIQLNKRLEFLLTMLMLPDILLESDPEHCIEPAFEFLETFWFPIQRRVNEKCACRGRAMEKHERQAKH